MPTRTFGRRLTRRQATLLALGGLVVSASAALAVLTGTASVAALDHALLDALLRRGASGAPARHVVVVDIDDTSLSALGQWPWPRYRVAAMVDRIAAAQPAAVALDLLFPEPDRASVASLRRRFRDDFGVKLDVQGAPEGLLDNDGWLGEVMARSGTIGASYLYFDHTSPPGLAQPPALRLAGDTAALAPPEATGVLANTPAIAARTAQTGFINSRLDADGRLRRMPLLLRHGGALQPHMALVAAMRAAGVSTLRVEAGRDGPSLRAGPHRIPLDRRGEALLRLDGGPSTIPVVPALALLRGEVPAAAFAGKVVIVGTSAVGLNDLQPTALHERFPGAQVQAAMVEAILRDRHLAVPVWAPAAVAAACVLAGLATTAVFSAGVGIPLFVAGSATVAAALAAASLALLAARGLFVSPAAPLAVVALLAAGSFVARFGIERRRAAAWLRQLENARQVTIQSMAAVAETRDPETGAHIQRTQHYVRAIAVELRSRGLYLRTLTPEYIELLFASAPLHDIGKVGVPDHILLKPGRLSDDEMTQMKRHADYGRHIIGSTAERIDGENFLTIAGEIAATHHEKWDGSGYPAGLAGEAIPLSGRIMAVADVYDALISRRCYKPPFTHAHSTALMREMRGSSFDPAVLDAFFRIEDEIQSIAARYRDEEAPAGETTHGSAARELLARTQAGPGAACAVNPPPVPAPPR